MHACAPPESAIYRSSVPAACLLGGRELLEGRWNNVRSTPPPAEEKSGTIIGTDDSRRDLIRVLSGLLAVLFNASTRPDNSSWSSQRPVVKGEFDEEEDDEYMSSLAIEELTRTHASARRRSRAMWLRSFTTSKPCLRVVDMSSLATSAARSSNALSLRRPNKP